MKAPYVGFEHLDLSSGALQALRQSYLNQTISSEKDMYSGKHNAKEANHL